MPAVFGLARLFPLVSNLALALLLACSPEAPTEKLRSGRTDPNPATTRHQAGGLSPRGHEQSQHAADRTGNGREALIDLFNATDGESRGHDDKRLSSAQWENGTVHGTQGAQMRVVLLLPLVVLALTALSCTGNEPAPSPAPTVVESATAPTPDISAAVEAGIAATKEAEASIEATVTARVKATKPQTPSQAEREALVALYHATDGPNWRDNTNWLSDAPLDEWHGVSHSTFDDGKAGVVILSLNHNQLSGEIPPELGNLVLVQLLFLGGNQLSGEIPPELGNLASLKEIDLSGNQLSGCVPSNLQGQLAGADLGGLPFC